MPYKDRRKREEYHRKYYREYMRQHIEYRLSAEKNRSEKVKEWKDNGVMLYKFRRLSKKYGQLGIKIFLRDSCSCVKCGETDFRMLILDHIIPKLKGGKDEYNNLQTLCCNCHAIKHFMGDVNIGADDTQDKWGRYWMEFAIFLGRYSPCLSRQIGGVLVRDNELLSIGWNGPPEEVGECSKRNPNNERICPRKMIGAKSGERLDLCFAVHTEVACIINASNEGKSTKDATLYINCSIPCKNCLLAIINSGINRVVCNKKGSNTSNFGLFYDKSSEYIYNQSGLLIDFMEVDDVVSDKLYKI